MSAYLTIYCDDSSACDASYLTAEDDFWRASADAQREMWITDEVTLEHFCPKHAASNKRRTKT